MHKILMMFVIVTLLTGCNKSDEELISAAKNAVHAKVVKTYETNTCEMAKNMASMNIESDVNASCDVYFKPSAGLTFSDIKVYQHKERTSVCGIVSGRTDVSRIGARFVYTEEGSKSNVLMQNSKYRSTAASKKNVEQLATMVRAMIVENCQ